MQIRKSFTILSLFVIFILTMAFSMISTSEEALALSPAKEFAGGDGTEENPYQISNAAEFELMRQYRGTFGSEKRNYFELTEDIYLNSNYEKYKSWEKKAPKNVLEPSKGNLLYATVNGNDHTVYGAYINENPIFSAGLEGMIIENISFSHFYCKNAPLISRNAYETIVLNVHAVNGKIYYDTPDTRLEIGGLFSAITSGPDYPFENVSIDAEMTVKFGGEIGMLAGSNYSTPLKNCSSSGKLAVSLSANDTSGAYIGGITGSSTSLYGCSNSAEITVSLPARTNECSQIGGISGCVYEGFDASGVKLNSSEIIKCKNTGNITITTKYTMKFAKKNNAQRQSEIVAGIAAECSNCYISNCINEGDINVTFGHYAAGIVSRTQGDIYNCLNTGNITLDSCYGGSGICTQTSGNISYCENRGNISATEQLTDKNAFFCSSFISGILGTVEISTTNEKREGISITWCKNTGNISSVDDSQWMSASGIASSISVGDNYTTGSTMAYCYNTGTISGPLPFGIVISSSAKNGNRNIIKNCVNAGDIKLTYADDDRVGGIAFSIGDTDVTACYNMGIISSATNKYTERKAQLVSMAGAGAVISKCYILDAKTCNVSGMGIEQFGGKSSSIKRKTASEMKKMTTVKKVIKKAGIKK